MQRSFSSFETGVPCLSPAGLVLRRLSHDQKTKILPVTPRLDPGIDPLFWDTGINGLQLKMHSSLTFYNAVIEKMFQCTLSMDFIMGGTA